MQLPFVRDAAPVGSCLKFQFTTRSPTDPRRRQQTRKNPIKVKYGVKNNLFQLKTTGPRQRIDSVLGRPARLNKSSWPRVGT